MIDEQFTLTYTHRHLHKHLQTLTHILIILNLSSELVTFTLTRKKPHTLRHTNKPTHDGQSTIFCSYLFILTPFFLLYNQNQIV